MSTDVDKLLKTAFGEIEKVMTANTVIGDPVSLGCKTIIPVVGMSVDFGGGGGEGTAVNMSESDCGTGTGGAGGGAGGGFTIKPVALIIIDGDEIRVEHLNVEQLKFEKPAFGSAYQSQASPAAQPYVQSPAQPSSGGPDLGPDLTKEIRQLRRDVSELQAKLGITPLEY